MEKFQKFFAVMLVSILQLLLGQTLANAQSSTGIYSVTVNTPGTFGQIMLQTVDNWSDVIELTISGHLNTDDMALFSRMQSMTKLDISQVDINSVTGCTELKLLQKVILPQSVTTIEDNAFYNCTSLSIINLDKIEQIGAKAFYNCTNLSGTIKLTNLKTLGAQAFYRCSNISAIEMPVITEVGAYAFDMYNSYTDSKLTFVSMPNVISIGHAAFRYCKKLESVNIPNCVYLGSNESNSSQGECFRGCSNLNAATLCENLEVIPDETFQETSLKSIKFPSKLKVIGRFAFKSTPLSNISIPEGAKSINADAFINCPLESIILPSTLESIGEDAFYYRKETYNSSTGKYDYTYFLKDVYCKSVVPIVTSVFNNDMVKSATLHVPAFSLSVYKLDDNWYKFYKIEAIDGDVTDVTISKTFIIVDYKGLANNANITLTSSDSQDITGHLTISGENTLSLNNYIQFQNFKFERKDYYDENNKYVYKYTYPYCTTLITNNEVRANNVTTKIKLPTNQWSFLSMPYDVNVSSIVVPEGTMWVVRKYNGSNRAAMSGDTWENVNAGQTLNAGEGYIFHCVKDNSDSWSTEYVEFEFPAINNSNKNNIFSYNDVVKTIKEYPAEFSHNRGWNLIGNPYPSYLSSQYIEFPAPITIWNGEGYTAYSLADDEYVLRPNEAFFVQCPVNTNQMKFCNEGRTHNYISSSSNSSRKRAKIQSFSDRTILNFILSDDVYSDRTRLVLNESASSDYEIERDASKFMSSNETVPQVYLIDNGINYAINERPLSTGIFALGIRIGKQGNYKISLNATDSDYDVLLFDKETNEITNLTTDSYSFISDAQIYNNRFTVKVNAKGSQSSIDDISKDSSEFSVNGNKLSVSHDTKVSLYSIDGKLIYHGVVDGSLELHTGIYLLSINNTTHKIAIK